MQLRTPRDSEINIPVLTNSHATTKHSFKSPIVGGSGPPARVGGTLKPVLKASYSSRVIPSFCMRDCKSCAFHASLAVARPRMLRALAAG